jgi:hypothetical protein
MDTNKSLYFLHIPKTGGMTAAANLASFAIANGLKRYPPSVPPHEDVSQEHSFIAAHLGRYPISKIENIAVATMVREPLSRAISNFKWIYNKVLEGRPDYANISSIEEKLKYYLFEDLMYTSHRNIQSKFICSSPAENMYKDRFPDPSEYETRSKSWYLKEVDLTFDLAREAIDSFEIVDTTDNVERFIHRVVSWFNDNYPDLKTKKINYEILPINQTSLTDSGNTISSEFLMKSLSDSDIEKFFNLNSIDVEIYQYVKDKNI